MSFSDPHAEPASTPAQGTPTQGIPGPGTPLDPAPRRRRWLITLPVAFIVLLAIGWSGMWFYASGRVGEEVDGWIAAEAAHGRIWTCTNRELGGFPFRFELICDSPTLAFAGATVGAGSGQWTATAQRVHAVAQVWNPGHIIAEFQGPARLVEASTGREAVADWSLLQLSGVGSGGRPERVSVVAKDYQLSAEGTTVLTAREAVLHVRHHPGEADSTLDIATAVKGAKGLFVGGAAVPEIDGEMQATVTEVPAFRAMTPLERVTQWQQAGGQVKLLEAQLSAAGGVISASGTFGLDPQRRLDGTLDLSVANAPALFGALSGAGLMPDFMVNLAPAMMAMGSPTTIDGQPANSFRFGFRRGQVLLGMIPLGKVGPVF
ncbi:DUF2125 domain-containing protein [Ancylobacter pratisalsi]|uniref:DUF2125 domain-containing protein n=1 Tax=Ancylobacter pratisalsi TaxID=1745854 RepID=A0A6P1YL17_9HYPH|nr:DUF2125 domain-containing protein [Ancylobacter pratisalsi]QIB34117.1 DUF2125 domain-containing protein [Ancylobacter pratisalsi]